MKFCVNLATPVQQGGKVVSAIEVHAPTQEGALAHVAKVLEGQTVNVQSVQVLKEK